MDNDDKKKQLIEEIKRKSYYTDEGDESIADYTYDYLYGNNKSYYNYKDDYRDN